MTLWGDYYFMEALVRQSKTWNPIGKILFGIHILEAHVP